ncbi:hypothetical protein [Nostoc sp. 'Peltigera membranacea cyanobiont' 213]|nr:hypothetical protein [Nostoc sp. 'Peltigera membranacea cyanobiont' 213]
MSDWRGLGEIDKCLISEPTTFKTTLKALPESSLRRSPQLL